MLKDDLNDLTKGYAKGKLYVQLEHILIPTSFKDKSIVMLFVLSDLAENNVFYMNNNRQPVLASINIKENQFIQCHKGQNGSVAISLTDKDTSTIAPILPLDQIYKFNSFYIKLLDQKLQPVEFTNSSFPIDLTLALYFKGKTSEKSRRKKQTKKKPKTTAQNY